jgi:hypothetical protein
VSRTSWDVQKPFYTRAIRYLQERESLKSRNNTMKYGLFVGIERHLPEVLRAIACSGRDEGYFTSSLPTD